MNDILLKTRNIHAVGRNYAKHAEELGNRVPTEPVIFSKSVVTLTDADHLHFPARLTPIHFELELVLRIGSDVAPEAFQDSGCISHMALGIDFTARTYQSRLKEAGKPWHLAKSFRDSCFLGPLQTDFKVGEPFPFFLYQNGELRQAGRSEDMIFSFEQVLAFINSTLPLEEGDLIFTGTPAGVGPLSDGDHLRIHCPELQTDRELVVHFV